MDLLEDFMNPDKPMPRFSVQVGQVNGVLETENDEIDECDEFTQKKYEDNNTNYAKEYINQEEGMYAKMSEIKEESEATMSMVDNTTDLVSSIGIQEINKLKAEQFQGAFNKYNFDKRRNQELLIDEYREQILNLINTNNTIIIDGPTGSGKTTQVPQFILDDCKASGRYCKIVVTQPRRIAAISVARRVCEERNWSLGSVCGYQVGLESNLSEETILQYVTTGILLQKLIHQKNLHDYTHIIVDEVHERNQDMDFLLLIIRRFLNTNSLNTKVILMSATFNSQDFSEYFKSYSRNQFISAPVISIEKGGKFNTQIFYVEQLQQIGRTPIYEISEPKIEPSLYELFVVLIRALNRLDSVNPETNEKVIGNVLVFLPGILEIEEAHDQLSKHQKSTASGCKEIEWHILPLHSSITIEEQRKVFQPPPPNKRKIILSTNIAESSITVPDIRYVIDFCLTKNMVVDQETQYQNLQLQWASHVSCTQRSGRVGRVSDGRVYRLVTTNFYEQLPSRADPEITRAPLNQVVLKSKLLELDQPPKAVLALAMDPPELSKIDNTVLYLKEIGALYRKHNGRVSAIDGDITFLGRVMAELPLDVHLSKLIFLGHMFSCLNECIIMATGCSLNIFKTPFKERLKAYNNRLQWADGSASDLIAYINIYQVWQKKKRSSRDVRVEREWCKLNYVSSRSLKEWSLLVKEVQDRLERMHVRQTMGQGRVILSNTEMPTVIMVALCGAFYPYYFKRSCDAGPSNEKEAVRVLNGHDPFSSVYFTGFDYQQPGKLYSKTIKKQLLECGSQMEVFFDKNSSKVFVEFSDIKKYNSMEGQELKSSMPGKIKVNVYRAVRLRQLNIPIKVPVLERVKAWELAKQKGIGHDNCQLPIIQRDDLEVFPAPATVLPSLDVEYIQIYVCFVVHCGQFWAQNVDDETRENLCLFDKLLNTMKLENVKPDEINQNTLYAARFKDDGCIYRCKILPKDETNQYNKLLQIQFVDYGNMAIVGITDLFHLPKHPVMSGPPQAMECVLSRVQPTAVLNPRLLWTDKADQYFRNTTTSKVFYAKVYSVVQGIVHLELYNEIKLETTFENSMNYWLVKKGFAETTEESYISQENHAKRVELSENPDMRKIIMQDENICYKIFQDVEPPPESLCSSTILLKGPFSPFEMRIFCATASGEDKRVMIDGNSVNSVLLDSNPQDPHDRLVVAAHIGQNTARTCLTLRHTTLMPNIHGLPMLMSLLFCPTMETKPLSDGSRFAAILCGLGSYEDENRSLYPPHDICLTLDTHLTDDDLNKINMLRYWMNICVQTMEASYRELTGHMAMEDIQINLKNFLFELLKQKRKSAEKTFIKNAKVWGKCLYDSELLKPGEYCTGLDIWPLHSTMVLNKGASVQTEIANHKIELEEFSLKMKPFDQIECRFCHKVVFSVGDMRIHLISKQHRDAVKNVETNPANFKN